MSKTINSAKGLSLDLGAFNKASLGLLNNEKQKAQGEKNAKISRKVNDVDGRAPKINNIHKNTSEKEEEKKLGRPMIENDLLNKKLIASVTEEEYNKIIAKAGLVSVSTYLRTQMREAGII